MKNITKFLLLLLLVANTWLTNASQSQEDTYDDIKKIYIQHTDDGYLTEDEAYEYIEWYHTDIFEKWLNRHEVYEEALDKIESIKLESKEKYIKLIEETIQDWLNQKLITQEKADELIGDYMDEINIYNKSAYPIYIDIKWQIDALKDKQIELANEKIENRNKYYGLIKDEYLDYSEKNYITKAKVNEDLDEYHKLIFKNLNDPEETYIIALDTLKQLKAKVKKSRDDTYSKIKQKFYDLAEDWDINKTDRNRYINRYYKDIYNDKINTKEVLKDALYQIDILAKPKTNSNEKEVKQESIIRYSVEYYMEIFKKQLWSRLTKIKDSKLKSVSERIEKLLPRYNNSSKKQNQLRAINELLILELNSRNENMLDIDKLLE